jgi:hypothetical protein
MGKLEEIKAKLAELNNLVDSYQKELSNDGIEIGKRIVLEKVCSEGVELARKDPSLIYSKIPQHDKFMAAYSVITELFPELKK